ncbi:hypothetical protein ACS0TY_031108 [Phlomoides rotata]
MDDQSQVDSGSSRRQQSGEQRAEPVRSRWTPKPEQILILETIFSSGMVNPPKEETIRIRKLLEKFGPVGDANVFYWFQNRRSRSRRRQRQIQASLSVAEPSQAAPPCVGGGGISYENLVANGFVPNYNPMNAGPACVAGSTSSTSCGLGGNHYSGDLLSFSGLPAQQFDQQNPGFCSPDATNFPYQSDVITVFINGVATEVGRGAVDIKGMFGEEFTLFHSSGVAVQLNEYGFLVQGLQHGESYFLVSRLS